MNRHGRLFMAKSEEFYRPLLAEHERSGVSLRAFAEERGIPAGTLSCWRFKLKQRDAARACKSGGIREARFVSVSVVPVPAAPPERRREARGVGSAYEVVLREGCVVRVPADFDETRVGVLLRAVASC
jgi:hypothetical protein